MTLRAKDLEIGKLFHKNCKYMLGLYDNVNDHFLHPNDDIKFETFVLLEKKQREYFTDAWWCRILTANGNLGWVIYEPYQSFEELTENNT